MSEWATAMKIGTTALVLTLIERGLVPTLEIAQAVETVKRISRDQTCAWIMESSNGHKISAIEAQRTYLLAAQKLDDLDSDEQWVLSEWEHVLDDLERDSTSVRDRVDWAAKKMLLEAMQAEENLDWSDPWLQSIDLEYHNVDPEKGLYYELVRQGSMRRLVNEDLIRHSIFEPPESTRAFFRGRAVARFDEHIDAIQWDEISFADDSGGHRVFLPEPRLVDDPGLPRLNATLLESADFPEFMRRLRADT